MAFITWIVLGLIMGVGASKLINGIGEPPLINILLGITGAMTGGELFTKFWMTGARGLSLGGMLASFAGAMFFLIVHYNLQDAPIKWTA